MGNHKKKITRVIDSIKFMEFLKTNKISKIKFCKENCMAVGTLNKMLKGGQCSPRFVIKILKATGFELEELFISITKKPPANIQVRIRNLNI
jgi:hypothetical protein